MPSTVTWSLPGGHWLQTFSNAPWGQRDFRLLDPSGYYLRVTSRKVQA